jgi:predicted nucleic-acid-binding protein
LYGRSNRTISCQNRIQSQILAILNTPGLEVTDSDLVLQALHWYLQKNVDFIDAFNAAWMQQQRDRIGLHL